MCGIAGFYSKKISDQTTVIGKMTDALEHRGPDAEGKFLRQNFAMGMRRLAIIDLGGGNQPIFNEDKTIAIVFNGEIYNFSDLREKLLKKGHRFSSRADTETLVHLYEECGEKMLNQINGMFAFCIYDREKKSLLLARDPLGKKPLYYSFKNQEFIFASEPKAILAFPRCDRATSLQAMVKYFAFGYLPGQESIYKNIKKLLPGFYLKFDLQNQKLETKQYWSLSLVPKIKLAEKELIPCLEKKLLEAVEKRLISDVPLGVFLSGGLDSSLIVAIAAHFLKDKKVQTFSIGFREKKYDESRFAQTVAKQYHTEHHLKIFKAGEIFPVLRKIIPKLDEPLADPSLLPTYLLARFAREKVTVALSGDGGDEIFGGYPKYFLQQYLRYYDCLPNWMKQNLAPKIARLLPLRPSNKFLNYKLQKFIQTSQYSAPYRNQFWTGPFTPSEVKKNLFPETKIETEWFFEDADYFLPQCKNQGIVEQMMYLDMKLILPEMYLYKVDRMSMANSLEVRSPFLDRDVVEFAASLPLAQKIHGRATKYLLKKMAAKYLSKEIVNRGKQGFGLPLAYWIKNLEKEILREIAQNPDPRINKTYCAHLINAHCRNKQDHTTKIWSIYIYLLWQKHFLVN